MSLGESGRERQPHAISPEGLDEHGSRASLQTGRGTQPGSRLTQTTSGTKLQAPAPEEAPQAPAVTVPKVCRRQHVPVKENSLYGPGSLRTFTVTS